MNTLWVAATRLCAILALVGFAPLPAASAAQAAPCMVDGDACWEGGYHYPGINGTVNAVAVDSQGNLYVGGEFIAAGGMDVLNIARWDGTTWSGLGGGISRTSGQAVVNALALDGSGDLYVGGSFDTAGGVAANNIAKWNGSGWSALDSGVAGEVYALELDTNGNLYAGGSFSSAGGLPTSNLARWQQTEWATTPGGGGISYSYGGSSDGTAAIYALELDSGHNRLYVGGDFLHETGKLYHVAVLDLLLNTWSGLGDGMQSPVYALALDNAGALYTGASPTGTGFAGIAKWSGAWSGLGSGVNGVVKALHVIGGELYAGGEFSQAGGSSALRIARWRPAIPVPQWDALGSGTGSQAFSEVNALELDPGGKLVAGGRFETMGGVLVNSLARWNPVARTWAGADGGAYGLNVEASTLAVDGSSLYIGGRFTQAGRQPINGTARWNGSGWDALGSGIGYVHAMAARGGAIYAGGTFEVADGAPADYLARWNGSTWEPVGGGLSGADPGTIYNVSAIALDNSGVLYAAGKFTGAGGMPANNIARWSSGAWYPLGDGLSGPVHALALDASGRLFAGGAFQHAGTSSASNIAMWTGADWLPLGGTNGPVYALAIDSSGRLVVGGSFTLVGDNLSAKGIALWNGLAWSALGSGLDGPATALALGANDDIYAGGQFQAAGGTPARGMARWSGLGWSSLGSGLGGRNAGYPVEGLGRLGNRLYVAGYFDRAGDKASAYIGAYTIPPPPAVPAPVLDSLAPDSGRANLDLSLTLTGTHFSSKSVVRWNGQPLLTTYVNATQLLALVPKAKTANPGAALITAFTPDGGESASRAFTVEPNYPVFLPELLLSKR